MAEEKKNPEGATSLDEIAKSGPKAARPRSDSITVFHKNAGDSSRAILFVAIGGVALLLGGIFIFTGSDEPRAPPAAAPPPPAPAPPQAPAPPRAPTPAVEAAPAPSVPPAPAPAPAPPKPAPEASKRAVAAPQPSPAPAKPAGQPETSELTLEAPAGAVVSIDGKVVGTAPLEPITISSGRHVVKVVVEGKEWVQKIDAPPRRKLSYRVEMRSE